MDLATKNRPKRLEDVIGQERACKAIERLQKAEGLGARAFWIVGKSGQGKTTLAEIIASMVSDEINILRLAASDCTPAALKDVERVGHYSVMGVKKGRALIINEAHGLRRDGIRYFKDMLERLPKSLTVIFTTTKSESASLFDECNEEDASPFVGRCTQITLNDQGLAKLFAAKAREIAQAEGLDGQPIEKYVLLANKCKGSMREILLRIEAGEMLE